MEEQYKLSELPDYPAIKKLASALHKYDANRHGAAIMIGAGFSRSAALHVSGNKRMPLWYEFTEKLVTALNPGESKIAFSDPLRVAEEYRAYFGQAALNDQIRYEIDDEAWRPGELYKSLLKLPWSEIMTTNWDTLLERSALDVHSPYYTAVTKPSDLAWATSPRIVKFHGTIGLTNNFIAAQEDYRTYPEKFAPFVNFARQVFIENELCLLGFSGDDPNFLHWAGWVRDHLANHARKIYLVGALKLTAARRKHLESINISPIDIWDAVKHIDNVDLQHERATTLFLEALHEEGNLCKEPHDWLPSDNLGMKQGQYYNDPKFAAESLKAHIPQMKKDRESYPGWLVCPPSIRRMIEVRRFHIVPAAYNELSVGDRADLLYEVAWRYSISFSDIPLWIRDELFNISNPEKSCALSKKQQLEIALWLLQQSRWSSDNEDSTTKEKITALTSYLKGFSYYLPDSEAEIAYHQAIVACDYFDFKQAEILIDQIQGDDPLWKLRQASVLNELGRFDEAYSLIAKAYGELLNNHRRDQRSISTLSRLTWASWLLKALSSRREPGEELPAYAESNSRKWLCDPWLWIDDFKDQVRRQEDSYYKNQREIQPLFNQGRYRINTLSTYNQENVSEVFLLLAGLCRHVGIPIKVSANGMSIDLFARTTQNLVSIGEIGNEQWTYVYAIKAATGKESESITNAITRIGLACTNKEKINTLINNVQAAFNYFWSQPQNNSRQKYSVCPIFLEVLSRLVIRASVEKANELLNFALDIGKDNTLHHWLHDPLADLIRNSLESIPPEEHKQHLTKTLGFPLPLQNEFKWPNPVIKDIGSRDMHPGIDVHINRLINLIGRTGSRVSYDSIARLMPLVESENFLTKEENERIAIFLWGNPATYSEIPKINLYPHALLALPAADKEKVKQLVAHHLYDSVKPILLSTQTKMVKYPSDQMRNAVMTLDAISNGGASKSSRILPNAEQAIELFTTLIEWRRCDERDERLEEYWQMENSELIEAIGDALSYGVAPALSHESLTSERFESLQKFKSEVAQSYSTLTACVYFVHINEEIANAVEKHIRDSLYSQERDEVAYAVFALNTWSKLPEAKQSAQLRRLISKLVGLVEYGQVVSMQQILWLALELFNSDYFENEQLTVISEAVPKIFEANDYMNTDPHSQKAISASMIRSACAKLANEIIKKSPINPKLKTIIVSSKDDPLPEVRFSIQ